MIDVETLTPDQARNILAAREVIAMLDAKGIKPHRAAYKPLPDDGTVGGRHWVHARFGTRVDTCEHCQASEETSE